MVLELWWPNATIPSTKTVFPLKIGEFWSQVRLFSAQGSSRGKSPKGETNISKAPTMCLSWCSVIYMWHLIDRVSHRLKILTSPPFQIKIFNSHAHLVPYHIFLSLKMCNHITINYPKCCAVSTYISSLYYKCPTLFQAMLIS